MVPIHSEAADYLSQEPQDVLVGDMLLEDVKQDLMVDARKELADVALKHSAGAGVVVGASARIGAKSIHRPMRAFAKTAGVRIVDELTVEIRVQFAVQSMVQQPIAHARLVDVPGLRVRYFKVLVAAVFVSLCFEFLMQFGGLIYQSTLEF